MRRRDGLAALELLKAAARFIRIQIPPGRLSPLKRPGILATMILIQLLLR